MHVEMGYKLPPFGAEVDDQAVSLVPFGYTGLSREPGCYHYQVPHKLRILLGQLDQRLDVFPGHDKQMYGRFGIYIRESDRLLILIDDIALYLATGYTAEDAIHWTIPVIYRL
jgi:hypothetical protein